MKRFVILVGAAALALAGSARAQQPPEPPQQLDLAAVTCKDFAATDKETAGLVLMWLEAYYTEENAKPVVDFAKMKSDGEKINDYCGKNPGHSVITAADEVLGK